VYITTVILLALVWQIYGNVPSIYLMVGLATSVMLLGLPHGALDFAVAKSLGLVSNVKSAIIFICGYTAIASFSIIFWLNFPATALVIFLSVSIYHFSADWRENMPAYGAISLAAVVICGPAVLYSNTVLSLFTAILVSAEASADIIVGMQFVFALSIASFVLFLGRKAVTKFKNHRNNAWQTAEWITLLISAVAITPLLHFGLYFCLLHSPKHLFDIAEKLDITLTRAIVLSIPFVLLTVFIGMACYILIEQTGVQLALDTALLRWLFIGLFGLTMAHMLLVNFWHRAQCVSKNLPYNF
jgi:Brp/Blh family beta-carotene 15,15'-monooxygenase